MAQAKKHILPFFIPHLGCPQQCIFCDQHKIAGQPPPTAEEVAEAIATLPSAERADYELAFYGGSFTALLPAQQAYYLEPARRALAAGRLGSVRVSTRPDCINAEIIEMLRYYGVSTVELGVQSMQNEVLRRARRGHTAEQAAAALQQLQAAGFQTGVQLMPGLPGETLADCWAGARLLLAYRPDMLRIYPTVVLQDTALADLYLQGGYQPLALDRAAAITLALKLLAEHLGVNVIRMGLQPSEDLAGQVLAGPYHPAFGGLVQSLYWRHKILWALRICPDCREIYLDKRDISAAVGHKRQNWPFYTAITPNLLIKSLDLPLGSLLVRTNGSERLLMDDEFRWAYFDLAAIEKELLS